MVKLSGICKFKSANLNNGPTNKIYNLDFESVQMLTEMSFQKLRSWVSQEQMKWIDR